MADRNPEAPRGHLRGADWPAWRFGPDGAKEVFQSAEEVPPGWHDHPSKVEQEAAPSEAQQSSPPAAAPSPPSSAAPVREANLVGGLTRKQITAALQARGIEFSKNMSNHKLHEMLTAAVEANEA